MKYILVMLFGFASLGANSQCKYGDSCWDLSNNTYQFYLFTKKVTWEEAAFRANSIGGKLIEITDTRIQTYIEEKLQSILFAGTDSQLISENYIWVGGSDILEEGRWIWDGRNTGIGRVFWNGNSQGYLQPGSFPNWGHTDSWEFFEPNNLNGNEDCLGVALNAWSNSNGFEGLYGQWNDLDCLQEHFYLVDMSSNMVEMSLNISNEFLVYPNPTSGEVSVESEFEIYEIDLLDALLQPVTLPDGKLNLSKLSAGVYWLKIISERGCITKSIVKL